MAITDHEGAYTVVAVVKDKWGVSHFVSMYYLWYTKREAKQRFKQYLKEQGFELA